MPICQLPVHILYTAKPFFCVSPYRSLPCAFPLPSRFLPPNSSASGWVGQSSRGMPRAPSVLLDKSRAEISLQVYVKFNVRLNKQTNKKTSLFLYAFLPCSFLFLFYFFLCVCCFLSVLLCTLHNSVWWNLSIGTKTPLNLASHLPLFSKCLLTETGVNSAWSPQA